MKAVGEGSTTARGEGGREGEEEEKEEEGEENEGDTVENLLKIRDTDE